VVASWCWLASVRSDGSGLLMGLGRLVASAVCDSSAAVGPRSAGLFGDRVGVWRRDQACCRSGTCDPSCRMPGGGCAWFRMVRRATREGALLSFGTSWSVVARPSVVHASSRLRRTKVHARLSFTASWFVVARYECWFSSHVPVDSCAGGVTFRESRRRRTLSVASEAVEIALRCAVAPRIPIVGSLTNNSMFC
jgi:hypothetical protein